MAESWVDKFGKLGWPLRPYLDVSPDAVAFLRSVPALTWTWIMWWSHRKSMSVFEYLMDMSNWVAVLEFIYLWCGFVSALLAAAASKKKARANPNPPFVAKVTESLNQMVHALAFSICPWFWYYVFI